jgi:uncharacterized repeat protein (TIGR01451 family)
MEDAVGGSGNDHFTGDAGNNLFSGGPGLDVLDGAGGGDYLIGAADADELIGGAGIDLFDGGAGDDTLQSRDGLDDEISCGDGADTVNGDEIDLIDDDCEAVRLGAPTVTTGAATSITETTAIVSGTVNPRGEATAVYVELGLDDGLRRRQHDAQPACRDRHLRRHCELERPYARYAVPLPLRRDESGWEDRGRGSCVQNRGHRPGPTADLALAMSASPDSVTVGGQITYTVTVTNAGPGTARLSAVDDTLRPGSCS